MDSTLARCAEHSGFQSAVRFVPYRLTYRLDLLRLANHQRADPRSRAQVLISWSTRRPHDSAIRALLAQEHAAAGNRNDADDELVAAWLLLPATTSELVRRLPGSFDEFDDQAPPKSLLEPHQPLGDAVIDEVADRLLTIQHMRTTQRLVRTAMRRKQISWIADKLDTGGLQVMSPKLLLQLAERLHEQGEIRRPLELLSRRAPPRSTDIDHVRLQRERELQILESGVRISPVQLNRPSRRGVDALYLLHNSLPHQSGGYATRTHGLLSSLNQNGHQVVGITRPGFPSDLGTFRQRRGVAPVDVIDGVRYERLIGPVTALPRTDLDGFVSCYATMLQDAIDRHAPQVLHAASNWWNGHAAAACAQSLGIPSIYEVRGLWEVTRASRQPEWAESEVYRLDARYEAEAARAADRVITITNGLRDEMIRRGVAADKITVVPNAVDTKRFAAVRRDDELVAQLGFEDRCIIGFVGSMTFYEGLDDLLNALAAVKHLTKTPFGAVFVGDGPVRPQLEAQAAELGLSQNCRFVGKVPHSDVERYLGIMDVTPFPRKPLPVCEMVSPLKPLESMAAGVPVVVSDVRALAEMVPSTDCGVVVPKGNHHALASALATLIDDPDRRRELAANAREWVTCARSWSTIAQRVADVYDELIESAR